MCIVAARHFKEIGWVGVKNRDRNYKPDIVIKHSHKDDIERLLLWDEKTKWTEGINEFGISILSAAVATKKDEKEGTTQTDENRPFYSPDGKKIRTALLSKTLKSTVDKCIELELYGNTLIFDKDTLYVLEAAINEDGEFKYKVEKASHDDLIVRTNHGIWLDWMGYQDSSDDVNQQQSRDSSISRLNKTKDALKKVSSPEDMLMCISDRNSDPNPQMNPLRSSSSHSKKILVTTGQIQITPGEMLLSYRPLWCSIDFDFDKLDNDDTATYFEVISKRKLIALEDGLQEGFNDKLNQIYKLIQG